MWGHYSRKVAKTLKNTIREQDLAARWGGEEFLLLLPETTGQGGLVLAETLRGKLGEKTFPCENHKIGITMTFGLTSCTGLVNPHECIKQADEALYAGKNAGRDRCILYQSS